VTISLLTVGNLIPVFWGRWGRYVIVEACTTETCSGMLVCEVLQQLEQNHHKYLDRSFIDAQVRISQLQRIPWLAA
jgi:hypothetical protein